MNKNAFTLSANVLYNYYAGKRLFTYDHRSHKFMDSDIPSNGDTTFLTQSINADTQTFGISASYNKRTANKMSLSIGLGFYQKRSRSNVQIHIHKHNYLPDLKYWLKSVNLIYVPIRVNYFYKRCIVSVGQNFGFILNIKSSSHYSDNSKIVYGSDKINPNARVYFAMFFQESFAFQLFKQKGLYIQASAEHNVEFYSRGNNNWFMLVFMYIF